MSTAINVSRRDQNKLEKLERITQAARDLFSEKGISEVTTSEVATRAKVAAGTLFLYAKTKGELLLLAQNASYYEAHKRGVEDSAKQPGVVPSILSLLKPIIECNRAHVENGRRYLSEVIFGESSDVHRSTALELMGGTELEVQEILESRASHSAINAERLAKVVMASLFLVLSSPQNVSLPVPELTSHFENQLELILGANKLK